MLANDRWFSPGTPASSTTKTGRHDIAEILLKVALKHTKKNQNPLSKPIAQSNYQIGQQLEILQRGTTGTPIPKFPIFGWYITYTLFWSISMNGNIYYLWFVLQEWIFPSIITSKRSLRCEMQCPFLAKHINDSIFIKDLVIWRHIKKRQR